MKVSELVARLRAGEKPAELDGIHHRLLQDGYHTPDEPEVFITDVVNADGFVTALLLELDATGKYRTFIYDDDNKRVYGTWPMAESM